MTDFSLLGDEELSSPGLVLKKARAKSAGGTLTSNIQPGQAEALPNALAALRQRAADAYQQGFNLYNSEPDTSKLQEFARAQGRAGEGAMLNALAAQYAGEGFAPIQSQFLKKAASAQEPMKMAGGIMTPTGEFIKDPFADQERRAEFLMRQGAQLENTATTAETARERLADLRRAREAQDEYRNTMVDLRRESIEARRDSANNSGKSWRFEDNMRKDFDTLTKDLREELNATSKISQIVGATAPGQKPDAITQQSLIVLLNKFLDPGSVVREGEFDRVVKAQGLEGRVKNLKDRIWKGEPLNADTIGQINGLAQMYSTAATAKIKTIADNYGSIARKRGLDVESVISDPRFRVNGGSNAVDFGSLPK